jgi:hypothetical protein
MYILKTQAERSQKKKKDPKLHLKLLENKNKLNPKQAEGEK